MPSLLLRVGGRLCALPIAQIKETLRPLPVEPFAGAPVGVAGLAMVRGAPTPVVELANLLDGPAAAPGRFVIATDGGKLLALAVDAVLGIRGIPKSTLGTMPSLLGAARHDAVAAIGTLDDQLLLLLDAARMVPDSLWSALPLPGGAA